MSQPIALVYRGSGADLTFRSAGARRHALRGVPFEVDDATATILLSDPAVERFVPEQAITAPTQIQVDNVDLDEMSVTDLKVLATNLGLHPKARATKPELLAEIRAVAEPLLARATKPEQEAVSETKDEAPASDPTPRPGSITLEDIPAAGRIQQQG